MKRIKNSFVVSVKRFVWALLILPLLLVGVGVHAERSEKKVDSRPNIVFIMADDLGYGDLSGYGSEEHDTPSIDRLADEGMRFNRFYVTAGVCTPTRVAFLTGRHQVRVGFSKLLWPNSEGGLPESELTLPEALKAEGYRTGLVGKWHLGHSEEKYLPLNHGFDFFYGMPYPNDMGPMHIRAKRMNETWPRMPMMEGNKVVERPIDVNLLTQQYTSAAGHFIARNHHRPFFLFLSQAMPHTIIGASQDFRGGSDNGLYGDAVQELDWSVGEVLRLLRAFEIEDSTLVFFTSDNGAVLRSMYGGNDEAAQAMFPDLTFGSNGPLRAGKVSTFEGGIRVPAIARWPGVIPAGEAIDAPVSVLDFYPTALEVAGAELPRERNYDGRSILEVLMGKGEAEADRTLYFGNTDVTAMIAGEWKLVLPKQPGYLKNVSSEPMLFHLSKDQGERRDLAARQPERVSSMLQRLESWERRAMADPISR